MSTPGTKTISVTMWTGQSDLISQAAEKKRVSVSEFIRAYVIPAAAHELGVPQPEFQAFEPPHFRVGAIRLAADALGITISATNKPELAVRAGKTIRLSNLLRRAEAWGLTIEIRVSRR